MKRVMWYLKRVVWYFEEGDVVLCRWGEHLTMFIVITRIYIRVVYTSFKTF